MITYILNIGDVIVSTRPASYSCFGLGSCIGLFLQDRLTGIHGGAHIFLPARDHNPSAKAKFYNAENALEELLKQFKQNGSTLACLRAKITGGANVLGVNMETGLRNAASIVNLLHKERIYIAASDVGGIQCRTAKFESHTGELTVRMPQTNEFKIY